MTLFLKLLLAHLIGDFLLQSQKSVQDKEKYKLRSPSLYLHIAFHGLVTAVLLEFQYGWGILFIVTTHFIIDAAKLVYQNKDRQPFYFLLDQFLHILVLILVWYWYEGPAGTPGIGWLLEPPVLLSVVCVYILTQPAAIFIMVVISKWAPETPDQPQDSLNNAGRVIGILERLFVFGFVITGNWEAIGFLIAAKSVFRFGDLKESRDRKLTEYILIGTLISFGIALLVAHLYLYLMGEMSL